MEGFNNFPVKNKQPKEASVNTGSENSSLSLPNDNISDPSEILRINLAIGVLTLLATTLFLYLLNYCIYTYYKPDVIDIIAKMVSLTIVPPIDFSPEPVERLQFQLSLLCLPLFIFGAFTFINKKKAFLQKNTSIAFTINVGSIVLFVFYFLYLLNQKLLYIHDSTTAAFFEKNLVCNIGPFISLVCYSLFTYLFIIYLKSEKVYLKKIAINIISIICYVIAGIIILDVFLYNIFYLRAQSWDRLMETNAVFYVMTQVYAGKSLLVNINAQYGLYPLFLLPLFKIIGLSTFKFGLVMAALNACSFFLFYLGIKKVIKHNVVSLLVFLCLVFWQYWSTRLPLESTPRYYYQYAPIRLLFPSIVFFLFVTYQSASQNVKRKILPVLALCASLAILWNVDTGIAAYGATFAGLIYATLDPSALKESVKRSAKYFGWMLGCLLSVFLLLLIVTKLRSGEWPDLKHFLEYQQVFYISGFYMLAMSPLHFWNLPALVYVVACIFSVFYLRKTKKTDVSTVAFLFILGCGLFAYFQGRSYDTTITIVMYPAIICLGIFCNRMLSEIQSYRVYRLKMHEILAFFLVPFIFIADGAFSMLFYMPSTHSFAAANAFTNDSGTDNRIEQKISFIKKYIPAKDTVLILAMHNESYYYAAGNYYNPVDLNGTSELLMRADFYTLLDSIKNTRHAIIYDANHPMVFDPLHKWRTYDTVIQTLAKYTTIQNGLPDNSLILLKHGKTYTDKLIPDSNTIYYNDLAEFNIYLGWNTKLKLPENFSVEFIVSLGKEKSVKNTVMFSTAATPTSYHGFVVIQQGSNDAQYVFMYGNGTTWCREVPFALDPFVENHVFIEVRKNMITVYNNGKLCGQSDTNSEIKNSDEPFFFGKAFLGTVHEMKVSKL